MDASHVLLPSPASAQPRSRSPSPEPPPLAAEIALHAPRPTESVPLLHAPDSVRASSGGDIHSHLQLLTRLEDTAFADSLAALAEGGIDVARRAVAHARAAAVSAHDDNFAMADAQFVVDRERAAVRALLLRSSRAAARLFDAVQHLETAETAFLADVSLQRGTRIRVVH